MLVRWKKWLGVKVRARTGLCWRESGNDIWAVVEGVSGLEGG